MKKLRIFPLMLFVFVILLHAPGQTFAQSWTLTSAPTNLNWKSIVSSADGVRLVATVQNGGPLGFTGAVYASTNSGASWASNSASSKGWLSIAASADGSNLVAAVATNFNAVYTSTNFGATWTFRTNLALVASVASSSDGVKLVAACGGGSGPNQVFTSTNSGVTWRVTTAPSSYWTSVASSADGSKLVVGYGGYIYASTNSGATWDLKLSAFSSATGVAVASSADGNTLAWANGGGFQGGGIYTSTNAGTTWATNAAPNAGLSSVVFSADGRKVVALDGNVIFASTNSGTTWTTSSIPNVTLKSVTSSADGSKLAAVVSGGGIYTWQAIPALTVSSSTGIFVSWSSTAASAGFTLQTNSDLTTTNWADAGLPVNDDGTNKSVMLPLPANNLFFRLVAH